jgi:hypothetical protein
MHSRRNRITEGSEKMQVRKAAACLFGYKSRVRIGNRRPHARKSRKVESIL